MIDDAHVTLPEIWATHARKDRNLGHYTAWLQRQEEGKYDSAGALREEALEGDVKPRTVDLGVRTRRSVRIPHLAVRRPGERMEPQWAVTAN